MIFLPRVGAVVLVVGLMALTLHAAPVQVGARQGPDPAVLRQHAERGERALAEQRYAEAAEAYETLRRLSPETAEVHARLGLIYFQQGRFADAMGFLLPVYERFTEGFATADLKAAKALLDNL